jgi:hypothetical protein
VPAKRDKSEKTPDRAPQPRFNRALLVKVGLGALALMVVIEGLVIAGLFSAKPTLIVATPPPRSDLAGPVPVSPIATATPAQIVLPSDTAAPKPASEPTAPPAATPSPELATSPAAPPPVTGRFGGIQVTAPIELNVFEGDKLLGSTAGPIAIVDGSHALDLVNDELGFQVRQTVTVKAGQMTPIKVPVPNGRISINAVPWAEVFIDGTPAGQTPLANLSLQIGKHEIVFRHPQLGSQTQTAVVKVEGLTRLSVTFQQ